MKTMESYRRAQDGFDAMLATVPADRWDAPSACWTGRCETSPATSSGARNWCGTGRPARSTPGPPAAGAPHPGEMAGTDPVATWRAARASALETLTGEALDTVVSTGALGEIPLEGFVTALITDHLAHTWDIAHALGVEVRLDPDLIGGSFAWSRTSNFRAPGGVGPELTPPPGADEQTRWLAFLGRAPWRPVAA